MDVVHKYIFSIHRTHWGSEEETKKKRHSIGETESEREREDERGAHTGYVFLFFFFFVYFHKIFVGVNIPSKSYIIGKTILGWCQLYFIHSMIWGCNLTIFFLCYTPTKQRAKKTLSIHSHKIVV